MIKKVISVSIYYSGIIYIIRYFNRKIYHNPIKIYYAHGIISEKEELYSLMKKMEYLNVNEFEQRIKYLIKHYKFISLEKGLEYMKKGERPSNSIVLTFDDGYKSIYLEAWPILRKYKIPFTIFITTGPIGGQELLWYDKLLFMLGKTKIDKFKVTGISSEIFMASNDDEKKETFNTIAKYLKRVDNTVIEKNLEDIRKTLNISEEELKNNRMMLNWNEIKEMHETGLVSFGAHTINHPILTKVDLQKAIYEIRESKRIIEEKLGVTISSFAYPNGDYNTKIENIVSASGFNCACTTMEERGITEFKPFSLGRIGLTYEPFYIFGLRMAGMFDLVYQIGDIFRNSQYWLPGYILNRVNNNCNFIMKRKPNNIYLCICDHFEPILGGVSYERGLSRIKEWVEGYAKIADRHKDTDGRTPKHTFFFPIEEYEPKYIEMLSDLCHKGYGEVEIHLHHDNDTPENLKKTITEFKETLVNDHKLLCKDKETGEIAYGFVHGNWALDNSRPDGRMCGINNELQILQETGCYADFTMPSAPDITQTSTINSIYYAIDDPDKPKSHNQGKLAEKSKKHSGLLMVQGPLLLNWKYRKWVILPHIENGCIGYGDSVTTERIKLWLKANVHVKNANESLFVKLYTHGCQENNMDYLLNGGLDNLFGYLEEYCRRNADYRIHYVSAREMVNVIEAIENNDLSTNIETLMNYRYTGV